ncbi:spore coat protein [Clostridium sp. D2Q-11]|uniref:Spore coat protein n=1 Tax=Anaeromonas frigoriresistens TaxID=2683708 RepID=A0A942UWA0_9FIRM|nr:spore coat protein [Anaeromonas frigoriresistens]MBS4539250.1 spore coat protein [Anaeromonas frigoriresistens]
MKEKDMVNDVLSMTKASIGAYTNAIAATSNMELRTSLEQLRNEAEQFQYELGKIANQKGYYPSPEIANHQDRQQIKNKLTQGTMS